MLNQGLHDLGWIYDILIKSETKREYKEKKLSFEMSYFLGRI